MLKCIIMISVQVTIGFGRIDTFTRLQFRLLFARNWRHFYRSLNVAGERLWQWLRWCYYDVPFPVTTQANAWTWPLIFSFLLSNTLLP